MLEPATHPLIVYEWLYGLTECLHILGFAVAIGSIGLVDLHLFGRGFAGRTPADIQRDMAIWTILGLEVTIAAGLVILSTDPARYLAHPTMHVKLVLLVIAILYNYTVHAARVRAVSTSPLTDQLVATVSLLLWTSIVYCGVFYAFT